MKIINVEIDWYYFLNSPNKNPTKIWRLKVLNNNDVISDERIIQHKHLAQKVFVNLKKQYNPEKVIVNDLTKIK